MVSNRLVYKIKGRVNDGVERYKACLVDSGFTGKKKVLITQKFSISWLYPPPFG